MEGGDCNIPDAFLKKHGDNQAFQILRRFLHIGVTVYAVL